MTSSYSEEEAETYDIPINDSALTRSGFIRFSLPLRNGKSRDGKCKMTLYNIDPTRIIYCDLYIHDYDRTIQSFGDKLVSSKDEDQLLDDTTITSLIKCFENECKLLRQNKDSGFFIGNGNGKQPQEHQKTDDKDKEAEDRKKKVYHIQKYSTGQPSVSESILLGGIHPFFLQLDSNDGDPILLEKIELSDITLLPIRRHSYFNDPYVFESRDEIVKYLELAKKIDNFDPIFKLVRELFQKYIDAEDHYITILAADTIYSYFQDKFATLHYLICIGDNSAGKNSILTTFAKIGYRVFLATSVSAANVFTYLGTIEDCQGTLAEDELNHFEDDPDKMNVHKSGYSRSSGKIPKTEVHSNGGGRSQEAYLTYCFKIFACEELPDSSKAKGILDRSFIIKCIAGRPQYNIKDVFENTNDQKHAKLRAELEKTRKLLLAYRMLHHNDTIKDVRLNIYNREVELTKPHIRLFRESPKVLKELLPALTKLLNDKRRVRSGSLEAKLYTTIINLLGKPENNSDYIIDHESIIEEIRQATGGQLSPYGEQVFYTTDLGKVTHRRVIDILVDKFKATRTSKGRDAGKKRALKFNLDDMTRKGREYNVPDKIEILPAENSDEPNNIENKPDSFDRILFSNSADEEDSGTQGTQGTESEEKENHSQQSGSQENTTNQGQTYDNLQETQEYNEEFTSQADSGTPPDAYNTSESSPSSPSSPSQTDVKNDTPYAPESSPSSPKTNTEESTSSQTGTEPESGSEPIIVKAEGSFKCFYCDEYFYSNDERRNHKQQYHPDKRLDYPTQEDFENRLER